MKARLGNESRPRQALVALEEQHSPRRSILIGGHPRCGSSRVFAARATTCSGLSTADSVSGRVHSPQEPLHSLGRGTERMQLTAATKSRLPPASGLPPQTTPTRVHTHTGGTAAAGSEAAFMHASAPTAVGVRISSCSGAIAALPPPCRPMPQQIPPSTASVAHGTVSEAAEGAAEEIDEAVAKAMAAAAHASWVQTSGLPPSLQPPLQLAHVCAPQTQGVLPASARAEQSRSIDAVLPRSVVREMNAAPAPPRHPPTAAARAWGERRLHACISPRAQSAVGGTRVHSSGRPMTAAAPARVHMRTGERTGKPVSEPGTLRQDRRQHCQLATPLASHFQYHMSPPGTAEGREMTPRGKSPSAGRRRGKWSL